MNCPHCSATIADDSIFCPDCGASSSASKDCNYCGAKNSPIGGFCVECGKPIKEQTPISTDSTASNKNQESVDFVYLLSEEKLRAVGSSSVSVPYGSVAVTMVNNAVHGVQSQEVYKGNEKNSITDFLGKIAEAARVLSGQKQQSVKTYILMNLQDIPAVSFSHPIPSPGALNASLRFEFWIHSDELAISAEDLKSIGLFLQKSIGSKQKFSFEDFKNLAIATAVDAIANFTVSEFESQEARDRVVALIKKTTGISSKCTYLRGEQLKRRQIEVSKFTKPVACPECDHEYSSRLKFCEDCGHDMSKMDWNSNLILLQSAEGEQLTLRISLLENVSEDVGMISATDEQIGQSAIQHLMADLRSTAIASLTIPDTLNQLSARLSTKLYADFSGYLTDVSIIDIRTAAEEWFFKTDALINEELRKVEADKRYLGVEGSRLDLQEAAFGIALRRARQGDSEDLQIRRAAFEARLKTSELDLDEHALETQVSLKKEAVDDQAEIDRLSRERARMLREQDFRRDQLKGSREDEVSQAEHEIDLEKTIATHDIDLADMTGDAQSRARRREVSDQSFDSEESIRLKALEKAKLGAIEEDLQDRQHNRQADKLRAMAEMEANMAKQDMDFELAKVQGMQNMDAQQILAMQAAQLVKAGGQSAAGDIVESIAKSQADAAGAGIKEDLYKQMLQVKEGAAKESIDAYKSTMEAVLKTNSEMAKLAGAASANSIDGYKEAAKIAQTTNEKSMDSMAKVATAAAAKKPSGKEDAPTAAPVNCSNSVCDHVFPGKPKKFCPKCGETQTGF